MQAVQRTKLYHCHRADFCIEDDIFCVAEDYVEYKHMISFCSVIE